MHSLSLLMSLKNSHLQNDVTLVFTLMLVAYGAGARLVNMLNRIGVTMHWSTLMRFLDRCKVKKSVDLQARLALEKPVIVLLDNVNIYRGHQRHHRLFKGPTMKMWNFTVRGLLNPNTEGIEELFKDTRTSLESQDSVIDWTSENLKLETDNELLLQWEMFLKRYILCLLHDGLNRIPALHGKPIQEMNEMECNQWLSHADVSMQTNNVKIIIPDIASISDTSMSDVKSDVNVLPLSLEDNSTITGTSSILNQFAQEFHLSSKPEKQETLPFNTRNKSFTLKQAREHVEFVTMMNQHEEEMKNILEKLQTAEKEYKDTFDEEMNDGNSTDSGESDEEFGTTLAQAQEHFSKCDKIFNELYEKTTAKLSQFVENNSLLHCYMLLVKMETMVLPVFCYKQDPTQMLKKLVVLHPCV